MAYQPCCSDCSEPCYRGKQFTNLLKCFCHSVLILRFQRSGNRHRSPSNYSGKSMTVSHSHTDLSRTTPLDFEVTDFFSFGSPLGMLLAFRKIQQVTTGILAKCVSYWAVRQLIGRDCSQKILSPSIHTVFGNFGEQSLPIPCRTAQ